MASILELDPATYTRHAIHGADRIWSETNCYVDVLIELIHAHGYDPFAALPFTLAIDFEEDQWTFFKYPLGDLLDIYGFDIQELNPWQNLAEHVQLQVSRGYPVLVELDSYFLPDTAGSAYQLEHVKSTVAVNSIDIDARTMGYFHGQGYYALSGEDFEALFQLAGLVHERMLPPYIEYVKFRSTVEASEQNKYANSLTALRRQLQLIPGENPFHNFKRSFEGVLPKLLENDIAAFHKYSFATFRQFGACYELASSYIGWLSRQGEKGLLEVEQDFCWIAEQVKALQFQLARAMARKKSMDLNMLDEMAARWQKSIDALREKYLG